jgi:hypothetical protein
MYPQILDIVTKFRLLKVARLRGISVLRIQVGNPEEDS